MAERAFIFLISPPHNEDAPLQGMLHLAWLSLAQWTAGDDPTTPPPHTLLYLVTPGLIDQVNNPTEESKMIFAELINKIHQIANQFNIPSTDIKQIPLSDYLTEMRREDLATSRFNIKSADLIHHDTPTILPLKETLKRFLPINELPYIFQLIDHFFDHHQGVKSPTDSLPYKRRKKQDIRPLIINIINQANTTMRQAEYHANILNFLDTHEDFSTRQFISLLDHEPPLTGESLESIKRLFTTSYPLHEVLYETIASHQKRSPQLSAELASNELQPSDQYLALETVAFSKWIPQLNTETEHIPVHFTYISANGVNLSSTTDKGISFFYQQINAALWYQQTDIIQQKFLGENSRSITKEALQVAIEKQVLSAMKQLKDKSQTNTIQDKLLSMTEYNVSEKSIVLKGDRHSLSTLIESNKLFNTEIQASLKEAWSSLSVQIQEELSARCIRTLSEKLNLKGEVILILNKVGEKIKDDIKRYISSELKTAKKKGSKTTIDELLLRWFIINDGSQSSCKVSISDSLLDQLYLECSLSEHMIIKSLIHHKTKIEESSVQHNVILQAISENPPKNATRSYQSILNYIKELLETAPKIPMRRGVSMGVIQTPFNILPGHHSPAFIQPINSYRFSFSDSIIEQADEEELSSNYTEGSTEKNIPIQPVESVGGNIIRTFSENDLTSRYLTSSPTRLWAPPTSPLSTPLPIKPLHQPKHPPSPSERIRKRNSLFNINIPLWAAFGAGVICTLIPSLWFMHSPSKNGAVRSPLSRP